ncbi:patatin-like phospholipase family protein [Kordia sp. YSTF-M3]|uniref:Patatin-like phospholipase family protein n=1 Tax=Kordia aestuariivivens TaxID=2759037 RepID=A0ABR7Q8X5_9FLAO|nr:patatin-like phospholipase family protein [Kordia aestuariivivens]MBC8754987.1 patatin-like phospholipase family protein [Kordia aestuariivivens]
MQEDFIPFESIGLCFSGGGYRATFFSLGVVSYLEKIQYKNAALVKKVEAISTVSGGTLFGVAYSKAAIKNDYEFKKFFSDFYKAFEAENDKLLQTAIAKLSNDEVWKKNPHKKRSLINAFALTYADMDIYKGDFKTFEKLPTKSHLKYMCFNATEFSYGLAFRFQNTGMFANKPLNNSQLNKISNEIPLADIVASSSCFPLGFEPLVFPDDYIKDQQSVDYKALKSLEIFSDGVGIMDGGIADNQGIGSMINISERRREVHKVKGDDGIEKEEKIKRELDLIIVSDVASYKMDPWQPEPKAIYEGTTVKSGLSKILSYFSVKPLYWILLVVGILMMVLNSLEIIKGQSWPALYIVGGIITGIGILLTIFGIVAGIIKGIAINWVSSMFKKNVPAPLVDDVLSFRKLRLDLVQRMLTERISTTVIMVNDIFLKQIRRLNYKFLYFSKGCEFRSVTSTVYQLNGAKTVYGKGPFNKGITTQPSKLLESTALIASETPTTLWWDKNDIAKDRMDTLIACGQFTTCYTLMDYIIKLKKSKQVKLSDEQTKEIDDLYTALDKDWKQFNKNPMFHVDVLKA